LGKVAKGHFLGFRVEGFSQKKFDLGVIKFRGFLGFRVEGFSQQIFYLGIIQFRGFLGFRVFHSMPLCEVYYDVPS
jgi:hypothetical protein